MTILLEVQMSKEYTINSDQPLLLAWGLFLASLCTVSTGRVTHINKKQGLLLGLGAKA
jgi:hypothetical protein